MVPGIMFPGQYFDAETGLHYNRYRYYDSETGRYLRVDPVGIDGGVNLYDYSNSNPITGYDSLGLRDPDSEFCRSLRNRIQNVKNRIQRRLGQLDEDPLNLPEKCPGDDLMPSLSKAGHRRLINEDRALLASLQGTYMARCGNEPPNPPPADEAESPDTDLFDWEYWEELTGLAGAALVLYLILSEGSRLFPPRNLVPVP